MLLRLRDAVLAHFAAHRRRNAWPFVWRITLEGLLVSIVIAGLVGLFVNLGGRPALHRMSAAQLILFACIVAPVLQTLILQTLPVAVMRAARQRFWMQVLVSAGLFAAAHFPESFGTGIAAGMVGGFYFAFTYVHWRERSLSHAVWLTAATHAARNSLAVTVMLQVRAPSHSGSPV